MYGDPTFEFHASGSVAASNNNAHALFGNYEGLSNLNNDESLHVQVLASAQNLRLYPSDTASPSHAGITLISSVNRYFDLKPMRAGDASQIVFANDVAGSNAEARWVVWFREP